MQETLYDKVTLSERLEDLRKGDEKNKYTFEKLSKEIERKTGVSISHSQLRTYENPELSVSMNINNLLAVSKFYNVSIEYLLGKTKSKSNNYTTTMTANRFSLTDESMKKLALYTNNKTFNNNEFKLNLINYIIESDWFLNELTNNMLNYYIANDNKSKGIIEAAKQESIARFDLMYTLEKFINESKEPILHESKSIKINYLFDMPKRKGEK